MTTNQVPPSDLLPLMTNAYIPHMLYVAATLGIADRLADHPATVADLATATHTHAAALERLLHALASVGVFHSDRDQRWHLTPLAAWLQSDVPGSQRAWIQLYGGIQAQAWMHLQHSIQTGEPAFAHAFGMPYYDYLATHRADATLMDTAMDHSVDTWLAAVADATQFAQARTIVDVGGGHGALLAQVLGRYPTCRGILFDLPHVVVGASAVLTAANVMDRCTIIGGDMFTTLPAGGDIYVLSRVLLNWDDAQCVALLRACQQVMQRDTRVFVIDAIVPDGPRAAPIATWDVFLLVLFGARARTATDYRSLFAAAGLTVTAIRPTSTHFSIIEGQRTRT